MPAAIIGTKKCSTSTRATSNAIDKKININAAEPIHTYRDVSQFWTYKPEEFLKNPVYSRNWPPAKNLEI